MPPALHGLACPAKERQMKTLAVVIGPTAVGKTEVCVRLAQHFGTAVVNADSRQIYRGLETGTAAPTPEEKEKAGFLLAGSLPITEYYSAARFEQDALEAINGILSSHEIAILSGGSMMYVDAVTDGIDDIPSIDSETRDFLRRRLEKEGLDALAAELRLADPEYYRTADRKNTRRIVHALEIYYATGRPCSAFRTRASKPRPFSIIKIGLARPRPELYARINARVESMFAAGLPEEARALFGMRHLNALNTVGYRELFRHFDGELTLEEAKEKIKRNTRVYAKKQIAWYKRDAGITWFHPDECGRIADFISSATHGKQ